MERTWSELEATAQEQFNKRETYETKFIEDES